MPANRLRPRVLFVAAAILGSALVALGSLILAFKLNFQPGAPTVGYPAPQSALEAQRQDLEYFTKVMALDRAFSPPSRAAAAARIRALESLPEALPPQKLQVALMQVVALADNGHSRMDATADRGTLILPVRVTPFAEGFYVMRAAAPYGDIVGGRVDSIDGQPIDHVLSGLETLSGEVAGLRRQKAARYMVVQDLLYGPHRPATVGVSVSGSTGFIPCESKVCSLTGSYRSLSPIGMQAVTGHMPWPLHSSNEGAELNPAVPL